MPGRERSHRPSGGRCTTATVVPGFQAASSRSAKVITSATGPRAAPLRSPTSRCSAAAITARSTKRAITSTVSPTASCGSGDRTEDLYLTFRLRQRCLTIPSGRSERGTRRLGFICTPGRRARAGWGSLSTWAGLSTSCTRGPSSPWRSASKPSKPWRRSAGALWARTMTTASSLVAGRFSDQRLVSAAIVLERARRARELAGLALA